jgi:hypothetical protein
MDLVIDFGDGPRLFHVTKQIEQFTATDGSGSQIVGYTLVSTHWMIQCRLTG